jgi:hypothetical protein
VTFGHSLRRHDREKLRGLRGQRGQRLIYPSDHPYKKARGVDWLMPMLPERVKDEASVKYWCVMGEWKVIRRGVNGDGYEQGTSF